MDEQTTQEINVPDREYLLDERIKATKSTLKMDYLFDEYYNKKSLLSSHLYEYGLGFNQMVIIRRWIWRSIKLGVLYSIKGGRRLLNSRKHS